jgi:isopenicillin-N N-acyltransferase-like protein
MMKKLQRLEVIECNGSPYEIGKQYGEAAKVNIIQSIDTLVTRMNTSAGATKTDLLKNTRKYLPAVEKYDPELIQQIKGQAEGAGVTFDEVFALRCWFELRFYYKHLTTLCTSFAVTGEATSNGKAIVGQNFDVLPGITLDMVKIKRSDGRKELSLVFWSGGELTLTDAGLAIVLNVVLSPTEQQGLYVPCCCLMPKVMRQKRMGDALSELCTHGRSMLHYIIGSAEGDIFSVETHPKGFNVEQPTRDVLVHGNHYHDQRFKEGDNAIPEVRGSTYVRTQRLNRLIEKHYGELTPELMMSFMADHGNYPHAICGHPNEDMPSHTRSMTVSSVIMVPEDRVMYATCGPPCEYEYSEYRL